MRPIDPNTAESASDKPPPRIRIAIAYPWTKDSQEQSLPARSDPRWRALRDKVKGVAGELRASAARRHPGRFPLEVAIIQRCRSTSFKGRRLP